MVCSYVLGERLENARRTHLHTTQRGDVLLRFWDGGWSSGGGSTKPGPNSQPVHTSQLFWIFFLSSCCSRAGRGVESRRWRRSVSVLDFFSFAAGWCGVRPATATESHFCRRRLVFLCLMFGGTFFGARRLGGDFAFSRVHVL